MSDDPRHMQCMEVWGGNTAMDSAVAMPGMDAWVFAQPFGDSSDGGGDVYYVSSCSTGRITRMLLADVSGHGVAVADTGRMLREMMRQHVNRVDQTGFVRKLNEAFGDVAKAGGFATAVVMGYFAPTRTLSLCNAGHPPPMHYRAADEQWRPLSFEDASPNRDAIADLPLGVQPDTSYSRTRVRLEQNDFVLCYSDSAIESRDASGVMLGVAGLAAALNGLGAVTEDTALPRLREHLRAMNADNLAGDDVTLMLITPNLAADKAPFITRMAGMGAFMLSVVKRPFGGDPVAWPEISRETLLGGLLPNTARS